jgi:hypothetical protein
MQKFEVHEMSDNQLQSRYKLEEEEFEEVDEERKKVVNKLLKLQSEMIRRGLVNKYKVF